jgi:hypothetical protein
MKTQNGWAVTTRGQVQVWPDGQLGIWKKRPMKDDVGVRDQVVHVEIREIRRSGEKNK